MKSRCLTSLFIPKSGLLVVILAFFGASPTSFVSGWQDRPSAPGNQGIISVADAENHFTIIRTRYKTQELINIRVKGAFDDAFVNTRLGSIRYLGIPAQTNREAVVYADRLHIWRQIIDDEQHERRVRYSDQFGEHEITISSGEWLLLPAFGSVADEAQTKEASGQHYKAYRVAQGSSIHHTVIVIDALGQESVALGSPEYYCVPVEMQHGRSNASVIDAANHLIVYRISPRRDLNLETVTLGDQFTEESLDMQKKWFLAAPAQQLKWHVVEE